MGTLPPSSLRNGAPHRHCSCCRFPDEYDPLPRILLPPGRRSLCSSQRNFRRSSRRYDSWHCWHERCSGSTRIRHHRRTDCHDTQEIRMEIEVIKKRAVTKCAIILPQLLFLLEYAIRGLSNKCIYRLYLKTSKPRFAR